MEVVVYRTGRVPLLATALALTAVGNVGANGLARASEVDGVIMVKPDPPSRDPVDILTGKAKRQRAQGLVWDERVHSVEQVLNQFPQASDPDGYYSGWSDDYKNCVIEQVDATRSSIRGRDLHNYRYGDRDYARADHRNSANFGLYPHTAEMLPTAEIVGSCLASIDQKNDEKQREQARRRDRSQRLDACIASREAQLAQASSALVHARGVVGIAQATIKQARDVEAVSGVVDLDTKHKMGQLIVYGRQEMDNHFRRYRQLGGPATSADAVVKLDDPCEEFR